MIDWSKIPNFKRSEFREDPNKYAKPQLVYKLQDLRNYLGNRIHPSPVEGSLARFSGSEDSRHYAVGRKSDAIDIFVEGYPLHNWVLLLESRLFTGLGLYLDTEYNDNDWVMFHGDLRVPDNYEVFIWVRYAGEYYYPQYYDEAAELYKNILMEEPLLRVWREK